MSDTHPLNDRIAETVAAFMEQLTPETARIVTASFDRLAASQVAESAKTVSDAAPNFTLPNAIGRPVSLSDLLRRDRWC